MTATTARIQKELMEMSKSPPSMCTAGPVGGPRGNMKEWRATLIGPPSSPYAGGLFKLAISFPSDYPKRPPNVTFLTKIYLMNVAEDGCICLDILDHTKKWNPNISVGKILLAICGLLSNPNPDDPLNYVKAQIYKLNRALYTETAEEWTAMYANY